MAPGSRIRSVFAFALVIVTVAIASAYTIRFADPAQLLAENQTFGQGRPAASAAVALATGRAWWKALANDGIVARPDGGLEPVVEIAPGDMTETGALRAPVSGPLYDVWIAALFAVRGVRSDNLIADWILVLRAQHVLLVIALIVCACVALRVGPVGENRFRFAALFALAFALLSWWRPMVSRFVVEGIIDSAIAAPAALACVAALWVICAWDRFSRASRVVAAMVIGLASMVRAEFAYINAITLVLLLLAGKKDDRRPILLALACVVAVPILHGLAQLACIGHFVPLRFGGGQNLLEPIGQYANPFGIVYHDDWVLNFLANRSIPSVGPEADRVLSGLYRRAFAAEPSLFFKNFATRGAELCRHFRFVWPWPMVASIPLFTVVATRRRREWLTPLMPALYASVFFVFFAWFNKLDRVVAPIFAISLLACAVAIPHFVVSMIADAREKHWLPLSLIPLLIALGLCASPIPPDPLALPIHAQNCDGVDPAECAKIAYRLAFTTKNPDAQARAAVMFERSCDAGVALACTHLGTLSMNGQGVAADPVRAANLFKKACNANEPEGCAALAKWIFIGAVATPSPESARRLWAKACDSGSGEACYDMVTSSACYDPTFVRALPPEARDVLASACRLGFRAGCDAWTRELIAHDESPDDEIRNLAQTACATPGPVCTARAIVWRARLFKRDASPDLASEFAEANRVLTGACARNDSAACDALIASPDFALAAGKIRP